MGVVLPKLYPLEFIWLLKANKTINHTKIWMSITRKWVWIIITGECVNGPGMVIVHHFDWLKLICGTIRLTIGIWTPINKVSIINHMRL